MSIAVKQLTAHLVASRAAHNAGGTRAPPAAFSYLNHDVLGDLAAL